VHASVFERGDFSLPSAPQHDGLADDLDAKRPIALEIVGPSGHVPKISCEGHKFLLLNLYLIPLNQSFI
jgi:hypothetical protein